jgi:hypothetical protein
MKKVICDLCNGRGWIQVCIQKMVEGVWTRQPTAERCPWCFGSGTVDIDDPENLVKPDDENKALRSELKRSQVLIELDERKIPKRSPLSSEALEARKPQPPEELVGALQDRIHTKTGATRPGKSHKVTANNNHPDGCFATEGSRDCGGDGHYMCRQCARFETTEE